MQKALTNLPFQMEVEQQQRNWEKEDESFYPMDEISNNVLYVMLTQFLFHRKASQ